MKVPYPDKVEVSDYEIGYALMSEILERHAPGHDSILTTAYPLGFRLHIADKFREEHHDDAILAEAGNILMARALKAL